MMQNQEYVSWLGFPKVSEWSSFAPVLEVSAQSGRRISVRQRAVKEFRTESLAQAVQFLATTGGVALIYKALPQLPATADGVVLAPAYELEWSIVRPGFNRPKRIRDCAESVLWSKRRRRFAYFALRDSSEGRAIRLTVGGSTVEECTRIWLQVSAWIRTLLRIKFPAQDVPSDVIIPKRVRLAPGHTSLVRRRNDRIRVVLLESSEVESKEAAFELSGRGHEPRVSLNAKLAAIVRGIGLPSIHISGYGANNFYPRRVFVRAADRLAREFGRRILAYNDHQAWVADEPTC